MQKLLNLVRSSASDNQTSQTQNEQDLSAGVLSSGASSDRAPTVSPPLRTLTAKQSKTLGGLVENLPNEVLSEILYWCTPTSADQDDLSPRAAIRLSHVCKHWRRVALDSPRLWTYTRIPIVNQRLERALDLTRLYLTRSKMRPVFLDFDFVEDFSYYKPVLPLFERIVDVARSIRPEWVVQNSFLATHLEAGSSEHRATREEWYFWSAQPDLPSMSPPLLGNGSTHAADGGLGDYLQLANTPARKPISIEDTSITLRALRLAIGSFVLEPYRPWAPSLTFLVIKDLNNYTNLTTAAGNQILSTFPLLIHCSLHIDFEVAEQIPAGGALLEHQGVELAFLKSFSLSWSEFVNTGPLLDALSVPSLTELELDGIAPEVDGGGGWDHLVRLLRRNAPPLTHLILTKLDLFHSNFLDALALAPNLEGLWLEDVLCDEAIIRGMISNAGALGCLKTLVMLDAYTFDISVLAHELKSAERIRSRRAGAEKIKVYVDKCGEVTEEHQRLIEEMGLVNLEIGPGSYPRDGEPQSQAADAAEREGAWIEEVE